MMLGREVRKRLRSRVRTLITYKYIARRASIPILPHNTPSKNKPNLMSTQATHIKTLPSTETTTCRTICPKYQECRRKQYEVLAKNTERMTVEPRMTTGNGLVYETRRSLLTIDRRMTISDND
jgi:hypothetical protein